MAMTAEMKAEILAFLEQREQEKKRNRTTYQRVYEPYRARLDAFDYEYTEHYSTPYGPGQRQVARKYGYPIQTAMGTLLRAVYGVDVVAKLPAEQEEEMREVFDKILSVMETYKRRETE